MTFEEALDFRHACKIFDENKKISDTDFEKILISGQKAPSSMGMEPWDFFVLQNKNLREKIYEVSWKQPQITTCSHLVALIAKIDDLRPGSNYVLNQMASKKKSADQLKKYIEKYNGFARFASDKELFAWTKSQCYLAAQNMMMQAAILGIDSCPIEGFDADALNKILNLNIKEQRVAIMIPFGYRIKPQSRQYRRNLNQIVKYFE